MPQPILVPLPFHAEQRGRFLCHVLYLFQLPELFLLFAWLYLLALQPSTKGPALLGFFAWFHCLSSAHASWHPLTSSCVWAHVCYTWPHLYMDPFSEDREACARTQHGFLEWMKMLGPLNLMQRFLPFFLLCLYFWVPDICLSVMFVGAWVYSWNYQVDCPWTQWGRWRQRQWGTESNVVTSCWLLSSYSGPRSSHLISNKDEGVSFPPLQFSTLGHKPKLLVLTQCAQWFFCCDFKNFSMTLRTFKLGSLLFYSFSHPPRPLSSLFPKHVGAFSYLLGLCTYSSSRFNALFLTCTIILKDYLFELFSSTELATLPQGPHSTLSWRSMTPIYWISPVLILYFHWRLCWCPAFTCSLLDSLTWGLWTRVWSTEGP